MDSRCGSVHRHVDHFHFSASLCRSITPTILIFQDRDPSGPSRLFDGTVCADSIHSHETLWPPTDVSLASLNSRVCRPLSGVCRVYVAFEGEIYINTDLTSPSEKDMAASPFDFVTCFQGWSRRRVQNFIQSHPDVSIGVDGELHCVGCEETASYNNSNMEEKDPAIDLAEFLGHSIRCKSLQSVYLTLPPFLLWV